MLRHATFCLSLHEDLALDWHYSRGRVGYISMVSCVVVPGSVVNRLAPGEWRREALCQEGRITYIVTTVLAISKQHLGQKKGLVLVLFYLFFFSIGTPPRP